MLAHQTPSQAVAFAAFMATCLACGACGSRPVTARPDAGASGAGGSGGQGGTRDGGTGTGGAAADGGAAGTGSAGTGSAGTSSAGTGGAAGADSGVSIRACPGVVAPSGSACRTSADCPSLGYVCSHDASPGCGACNIGPGHQCDTDANCAAPLVCAPVTVTGPCLCNGGSATGTMCVPRCTGTSCAVNEVCESTGLCGPKLCAANNNCPDGTVCEHARSGADAHGCATALCASDGYACPSGYRCQSGASADAHGCIATSCNDGFKCSPNYDCDPNAGDEHHCVQRTCTTDDQCDCGACIQARCEDRLFVCWQQAA